MVAARTNVILVMMNSPNPSFHQLSQLYGDVDAAVVDRLRTLFTESLLAITVDLQAYQAITYPALKQHIDAVMQPLFTQQELLASRG